MWRILLLVSILAGIATSTQARTPAWELCRGMKTSDGPVLTDCLPLASHIDPQGQEIWIRSAVAAPADHRPHALHVVGASSFEAWLNDEFLGANGRPGPSASDEIAGRYQSALPIREDFWRSGENVLVLRMSSFHGGLRLARPVGAVTISPDPPLPGIPIFAVAFLAAGALLAAAFGFGVIHFIRRTGSSLTLAVLAGVVALQAVAESVRSLAPYPYPLHAWRLGLIWALAAAFAVLLVTYAASRFWPGARRRMIALTLVVVGMTLLTPGFDLKTAGALLAGVILAAAATLAGDRGRSAGGRFILFYLGLFLTVSVVFPRWLLDLSFFLLAAFLILPLLMAEVIRLGRDDRGREAALIRAASRTDRLTVASARGVELVPLVEIVAAKGADDYVELQLSNGRRLLHATRLDRLEVELPAAFRRAHRSAIANLAHVQSLEREGGNWRLQMTGGITLPVSRTRVQALREALDQMCRPEAA